MRSNKHNGDELNDGLLYYGTKRTVRDSNKRIIDTEFIEAGKLYYKIKSFKYDDFKQYFGIDIKIDLKVKTYNVRDIDDVHLIKINNEYYDITSIDKADRFLYLYLSKRRDGKLD